MTDEVCFMTAAELARRIRARELSPIDVVDSFLTRIERRNETINAYVTVLADDARNAARSAEQAIASGSEIGPLHGVPIALKDYEYKAGVRNTFGSRPFRDFVPTESAIHVERLEAAGAIVLGKTNLPEFGHKGATDNLLFGPTSTPFAPGRNAGGSSGGSAAAVADGLAALAQGGDGGGSVRIPASFCGVFGLKASPGRVAAANRPDAFGAFKPYAHVGPLARTVEDAALMMSVLGGFDARDPLSVPGSVDYLQALHSPVRGLRVAYSPDLDVFPAEEVAACGAHVEEVDLGIRRPQAELAAAWIRWSSVELAAMFALFEEAGRDLLAPGRRQELCPEVVAAVECGRQVGAVEYTLDDVLRTETFDAFERLFERYDLLLTPTLAVPPFENRGDGHTLGPTEIAGESVDPLIGWCLTYPLNFTGHCAASVPAGFTIDGLPIGMQIVGRRFDEATLLAAAAAFESARPWYRSYERLRGTPVS